MCAPAGTGPSGDFSEGATALLRWLASRDGARFVADARSSIGVSAEELEAALGSLEADGRVVVQHNFCADPHFVDDDLRIVALVDNGGHGDDGNGEGSGKDDPRAQAASACERLWQRWLADFLGSHRCT